MLPLAAAVLYPVNLSVKAQALKAVCGFGPLYYQKRYLNAEGLPRGYS